MTRGASLRRWSSLALLLAAATVQSAVLPEDRADVLYHRYDGGGITIQGPSVLVRKKLGESYSVSGNYYVDAISSASIDVVTQASPYKEKRTQYSLGTDLLHGKTTYSAGFITSTENDYDAQTAFASISQDLFGDLTTISFGYTRGWDVVGMRDNPDFNEPTDRRNWTLGISQVLTRNMLMGLNVETSESEGFLNNPYRQVRYADPAEPQGYSLQKERYPHTRTGNAAALQLKYYLPWRAALDGNYRYYDDTWGIRAHTARLGYTHPWRSWTFDGHVRHYTQNAADFYSDLFPYYNAQNFLARDRELATFNSLTLGVMATWQLNTSRFGWIQRGTLNLSWDHLHISYDDYRDLRVETPTPGSEPLYTLDANVMQFFISIWF